VWVAFNIVLLIGHFFDTIADVALSQEFVGLIVKLRKAFFRRQEVIDVGIAR